MNELTHLDLFSGIGGFALAAKWNGYRTVAFRDWKDGTSRGPNTWKGDLGKAVMPSKQTGSLNPTWVEWLMGYPIEHTVLKDWATPSSRKSRRKSSETSTR